MIISIGHAVSDYLYDVFVLKFDFWLAFGIVAQLLFTARFLVQWLASEREGKSVMPLSFWYFSMAGGLMTLIYGIVRREPIIIMGQALAMVIYTRNLILIFRNKARANASATLPPYFPVVTSSAISAFS
jgi:lipid-A-disaccharide synthase-like uncharacterized protein